MWATRQREAEGREITAADLALGSDFHLSNGGDGVDGPALSAWGHVATGGFETEEDGVTMDGDVTTGVVGFDAEWAPAAQIEQAKALERLSAEVAERDQVIGELTIANRVLKKLSGALS